ncbi:TKL protein kinase [Phytophthora megakarya]|uniref:TKL protein kinase n=1 Tax=Phytophthora megakarya TaxID=4795 RepID=A0A225WYM6_9STRA|nr:TKL protein kinase [Phytophthora megakarya]
MESSVSLHTALAKLIKLQPRTHQVMFTSIHQRALDIGNELLSQIPKISPKKGRRIGIFRRHSSSSKKKLKKDKKRVRKLDKTQSDEWDFIHTEPIRLDEISVDTAISWFQKVVESVDYFVTTFSKTDKFVFHLASMRRMYLDLHGIGVKLDFVEKIGGLQENHEWENQLQLDRDKEETELSTRAAKNALPFARNMLPHEPMEALTLLKFEIDYFKPGNSIKHVASMKKVFFSVVRSSNGRVAKIPEWYIPPYAVNYSREEVMNGSVGTAHRGFWVNRKPPEGKKPEKEEESEHKPRSYKVVVKRIFIHADAIEFFRQEVEAWSAMDHPHILKLYGASHCSRPALLVYEDATNGPLVNYLMRQQKLLVEKHRERQQTVKYRNQWHALWCLLLEAAEGLKYLHMKQRLVHGNMKSDNILVTSDGHVKLTDFGLGMLALQNQAVQDKKFQELGWRAPNCCQDKKLLRRPSFQDDIYSFGLCILDVLVPEFSSIGQDESHDALKHIGDEGFNPLDDDILSRIGDSQRKLVKGMCEVKPEDRLTLTQVILHMEELRDVAERGPADPGDCRIL